MKKSETKESPVYNIWGWPSIDQVATDVWNSIHASLLEGNFVFAYKGNNADIKQFIITKRDQSYMLGAMYSGYTMLLPQVTSDYIKTDFTKELKKFKLDSDIIINLEKCL